MPPEETLRLCCSKTDDADLKTNDQEGAMKRNILCGLLAVLFLLTGIAAYADTMKDIQEHKSCKYCNMDREKYAHSRMLVEYADGSTQAAQGHLGGGLQ
jgi:hypothetical protein